MNMRVQKINSDNNIKFKSGLTQKTENVINHLNIEMLEREFKTVFDIDAKFLGNKSVGGCFAYIINLCQEASDKYRLPFYYCPPSIRLYKPSQLLDDSNLDARGFCTLSAGNILEDEKSFNVGSIFIREIPDSIRNINRVQEQRYRSHISSSSNFLGLFLHEWFHNIHINLIGKKLEEENFDTQDILNFWKNYSQKINIFKKIIIRHQISKYASTSYYELFSEVCTKLLTDSIDQENMTLRNNPMDGLRKMPSFVQKFINKELS